MNDSLLIDPLRRLIEPDDPAAALVVAFSGGLDSTVLLDVSRGLRSPETLVCCHVHHGLQPQADAWARHCLSRSAAYGIRCEVRRLDVPARFPDGVEAWAGAARRDALLDVARRARRGRRAAGPSCR
ncbi:MAG: ATP-binding protein [Burkholderiaceae bacterium]